MSRPFSQASHITWLEFLQNGYIMAVVVLLMVLGQGTLSQNSTHVINVAGIRLKNALQVSNQVNLLQTPISFALPIVKIK